jgi:hypothetical protein
VTRETSSRSFTRSVMCSAWRAMISLALATLRGSSVAELQQLGRGDDRRQRIAQLVRQHRQELVLLAVRGAQLVLDLLAAGDVAALDEDAVDVAGGVADRLVDEVDEALFQRPAGLALQAQRQAVPTKGSPLL